MRKRNKGHLLIEFAIGTVVASAAASLAIQHAQASMEVGQSIINQQQKNEEACQNLNKIMLSQLGR